MSKEEAETRNPLPPPPAMADRQAGDGGKYPYQLRANPSFAYGHYGDRSDKMWTSWLVPMFLVANIVVFVVLMYVNNCPRDYGTYSFYSTGDSQCVAHFLGRFSFLPWKENPLLGPSSLGLLKMGAVERFRVVYDKQGWRLLSSIWLHAGLFHLIVNTLSLIFVGIRLEQQFGFVKVGVIYVVSGIGGSILSCFFLQYSVSAGASAPLFGLLGAMSAELITNCGIYANKAAAFFTLIALGAVNAALGILPRVGNFGNIGGFVTGFLLGFVLLVRPQYGWVERRYHTPNTRVKAKYKAFQYVLWMVALILLIAGFGVALVMLFKEKTNGNKHCSWCHYLTCVPTSKWYCQG